MAARGSAGAGATELPPERHAPRWGDFAITGEHLPALRAGWLVCGERRTAHEGTNPAGAVCGRLCPGLRAQRRRGKSLCSALQAIREVRIAVARGENATGSFRATGGPGRGLRRRGDAAGHLRLSGFYPSLGQNSAGRLGDTTAHLAQAAYTQS